MIQKTFRKLGMAALLFVTGLSYTSCDTNDGPITPPQPHHNEEVAAVTLKLVAGHFHGVLFHQDFPVKGEKYLKAIQEIRLNRKDNKWVLAEGSDTAFFVRSGNAEIVSAYGLWITYLAADGDTINKEFIEKGADLQHQHFFSAKEVKGYGMNGMNEASDKETVNIFNYTYMDTTPWNKTLKDKGTKLNGITNPIGFKGWFNFLKPRKKLTLWVELMHAKKGKLVNGVASPFHAPTAGQRLSNNMEVTFGVPVYVLHSRTEEGDFSAETGMALSDLTENDARVVRAVADAYGISMQEALEALLLLVEGDRPHSNGGLWF